MDIFKTFTYTTSVIWTDTACGYDVVELPVDVNYVFTSLRQNGAIDVVGSAVVIDVIAVTFTGFVTTFNLVGSAFVLDVIAVTFTSFVTAVQTAVSVVREKDKIVF